MEIKIKNKIKVGDQTEIIEEIHTCEVMEKGDYTYLVHHNSEKEKVVIKLNQDELVMTRFSNPKSIAGNCWSAIRISSTRTDFSIRPCRKVTRFCIDDFCIAIILVRAKIETLRFFASFVTKALTSGSNVDNILGDFSAT